jgi:hypothetical protein
MTKKHDPCTSPHVNFNVVADRLSRVKSQTLYHFGSSIRFKNRRGGLSIRTEQRRVLDIPAITLNSLESDELIWASDGKVGLTRFGREIAGVIRNREAALREARQDEFVEALDHV